MRRKASFATAAACLSLAVGLALAPVVTGCSALLDAARQRLALFGVAFDIRRLDVSRLVYPSSLLGAAAGILDRSALGQYGVDVRVGIRARNSKPYRAVFDGAAAALRVQETSPSDPAVSGSIPAFTVEGGAETSFEVTFPLRLNSPVFGKQVWKNIVRGKDIPYRVDADLTLRVPEGTVPAEVRTLPLNLITSSVNVRESSSSVVEGFLKVLDLAF